MSKPALVAVDWGTSACRGYLMSKSGEILRWQDSDTGILNIEAGGFSESLAVMLQNLDCRDEGLPIVAAGMITSRQGWVETAYLDCPVTAKDLSNNLILHPDPDVGTVAFTNGVCSKDAAGRHDVMRGEEVQIVGASGQFGEGIYILPGTHSKWAEINNNRLCGFATYMTGEVFSLLSSHSILGRLMTSQESDSDAFAEGVAYGYSQESGDGGLLHKIFSARTQGLFDKLRQSALSDYLSGILIGEEIAGGVAMYPNINDGNAVLIGRGSLVARYQHALDLCGIESSPAAEHCAAVGIFDVARQSGLLR